jgi:hypothetical protein
MLTCTTNTKVIISGNLVEIYHYENPVFYNTSGKGGRRPMNCSTFKVEEEHRKVSITRAAKNIKRLLASNFPDSYKFLTLTFSEASTIDATDIYKCKHEFKKFKKRLRRYLSRISLEPSFK